MKKTQIALLIAAIVVFAAGGAVGSYFLAKTILSNEDPVKIETEESSEPETEEAPSVITFEGWTDDELLSTVPALVTLGGQVGSLTDVGEGNYMIDVNGVKQDAYASYLSLLQDQGYELIVDNGEDGIDGAVFTSTFQKDSVSVTVSYQKKTDKVYVIAGEKQEFSKFLTYDPAWEQNKVTDQTMLAMVELLQSGNSFVFRLKNGHFIVNDGGHEEDMIYLIEYLESFMDKGQKPVIDAWIISHAHSDHMGAFYALDQHPEYADRLIVEEILYNQPSMATLMKHGGVSTSAEIRTAGSIFRTSGGKKTPVIRPIMGQKYYYCDVVMEVMFSQEFLPLANYSEDLNDSSTFLMYVVEGQKCLLGGDGDYGEMQSIMRCYDKSSFELTVFTNLHHGINVFDVFTDFCTIETVLVPFYDGYGLWPRTVANGARYLGEERVTANQHLVESVKEIMTGYGGTLELLFPYTPGTAKRLPGNEWRYNGGQHIVGFPETVPEK